MFQAEYEKRLAGRVSTPNPKSGVDYDGNALRHAMDSFLTAPIGRSRESYSEFPIKMGSFGSVENIKNFQTLLSFLTDVFYASSFQKNSQEYREVLDVIVHTREIEMKGRFCVKTANAWSVIKWQHYAKHEFKNYLKKEPEKIKGLIEEKYGPMEMVDPLEPAAKAFFSNTVALINVFGAKLCAAHIKSTADVNKHLEYLMKQKIVLDTLVSVLVAGSAVAAPIKLTALGIGVLAGGESVKALGSAGTSHEIDRTSSEALQRSIKALNSFFSSNEATAIALLSRSNAPLEVQLNQCLKEVENLNNKLSLSLKKNIDSLEKDKLIKDQGKEIKGLKNEVEELKKFKKEVEEFMKGKQGSLNKIIQDDFNELVREYALKRFEKGGGAGFASLPPSQKVPAIAHRASKARGAV